VDVSEARLRLHSIDWTPEISSSDVDPGIGLQAAPIPPELDVTLKHNRIALTPIEQL
jgi:hypothetical protein